MRQCIAGSSFLPCLLLLASCLPQPAGQPPLLHRDSLLSYRFPRGLDLAAGPLAAPTADGNGVQATTDARRRRAELVQLARQEMARNQPQPAPDPLAAASFIANVYKAAGRPLTTGSQPIDPVQIQALAQREGFVRGPQAPLPGDIAFFFCDPAGGQDQGPTHLALLERSDADGTLHLLTVHRGQLRKIVANPSRPHLRRVGKKVVNSYLRQPRKGDRAGTPYLAGEMLAGYATLIR